MYYVNTTQNVRAVIEAAAPGTEACEGDVSSFRGPAPLSHLLWMCDEIKKWNTSDAGMAAKAGRWIGRVVTHLEMHGMVTNEITETMIRGDKEQGYDIPHHIPHVHQPAY